MSPALEIKRRKNMDRTPCVAPFINGWNVWDIPEKEWTPTVEKAILHAYELGWRHCTTAHADAAPPNFHFALDARFKEPKP